MRVPGPPGGSRPPVRPGPAGPSSPGTQATTTVADRRGPAPSGRRRASRVRVGPRRVVLGAAVMALLLLPALVPATSAQFTAVTGDTGNTVTAGDVAAPTDLTATQTCAPGPGIALRAASSATGSDSLTLPTPTGTVAGDVLVAQVANRYTAYTLAAPAGWQLVRRDSSGTEITSAVLYRVAVAGEPASATFTLSGTSGVQMAGGIAAYSGVRTSGPVDVSAAATGYGATATMPSVTTTTAGARLLYTVTKRQEDLPAPTGTTQRWRLMSGTGTATEGATGADEAFAGPGTTPSRSTTSSSNFATEWVAHTVALRPASDPPSAQLAWVPSTTTDATGYDLERLVGGAVQATASLTPASASGTTDGPLVDGTTYTHRLRAYRGTWTSDWVSVTSTPAC